MVEMIEMSCTDSHSRAVFSTWNYRASRHSFNLPLTSNKFFSKYICLKLDAKSASLVACVASDGSATRSVKFDLNSPTSKIVSLLP
jgi:hypothetical protein